MKLREASEGIEGNTTTHERRRRAGSPAGPSGRAMGWVIRKPTLTALRDVGLRSPRPSPGDAPLVRRQCAAFTDFSAFMDLHVCS